MIQDTMRSLVPGLQPRDGPMIALIRAADTAPAVLDLLPLATGAAEVIWDQQLSPEGLELSPDHRDEIAEPHPKREVVRSRIFR